MNAHRQAEVGPPTVDDFEVLKETLLMVASEPDAVTKATQRGLGLFVKIERLYVEPDLQPWPPLTLCLSSLLRTTPGSTRMLIRYRELSHNAATENSSLNHDYIFTVEDHELVEFGQSIRACPEIPSPQQTRMTNNHMNQADAGAKILKQDLGNQLEISAGDCGVLFDRMLQLLGT